jgi:transposase
MDGKAIDMPDSRKRPVPAESSSSFVPVVSLPPALPPPPVSPAPSMTLSLHVRLSNGVELDLSAATIDELTTVVQMFGRMPCSGSTKS